MERIDFQDRYGFTCLHRALMIPSQELVEIILKKDKKLVNVEDNQGNTPIHFYRKSLSHF